MLTRLSRYREDVISAMLFFGVKRRMAGIEANTLGRGRGVPFVFELLPGAGHGFSSV